MYELRFSSNAVRMKKLLQQSSSDDVSWSDSEGFETIGDKRRKAMTLGGLLKRLRK